MPQRADLHESYAVGSPQRVVVLAFQPSLPEDAAEPDRREASLGSLGLRQFPDVAHQVRHQRAVGVMALRLGLNQQAREDQAPLLERRDDLERGARHDVHRQVRRAAVAGQDTIDRRVVELDDRRDAPQRRPQRVFVGRGQQGHRVPRHALREDLPVAVGDDAAGRRERDLPQPVGLGLQLVLRMLEDLRAEEDEHQGHRGPPHYRPRDPQPALEQVGMERTHASPRRMAT